MFKSVRKTSGEARNEIAKRAVNQQPTATQCSCGTWRTPGVNHKKNDTGETPLGADAEWCQK